MTAADGARVAVVTDSTAYLPADVVARSRICVVPLQVVVDGRARDEGSPAGAGEVADALRRRIPVTTSQPSPAALRAAYDRAAAEGASAVVSVHLSGEMSGTCAAAALAARGAPLPVCVVDSRSLGMGLGYAVLAAAEAVASGAAAQEAAAAARGRAERASVLFYVDTLEHLRRGGRMAAAQALLGSALAIKPLLQLDDGRIVPLERVRTAARAVARLEELALERSGDGLVDVAVHHLAAPAAAAALAGRLAARVPKLGVLHVSEVGAVVGAHVGPGMLAVVVSPP